MTDRFAGSCTDVPAASVTVSVMLPDWLSVTGVPETTPSA